jgi:hypothetical protein
MESRSNDFWSYWISCSFFLTSFLYSWCTVLSKSNKILEFRLIYSTLILAKFLNRACVWGFRIDSFQIFYCFEIKTINIKWDIFVRFANVINIYNIFFSALAISRQSLIASILIYFYLSASVNSLVNLELPVYYYT